METQRVARTKIVTTGYDYKVKAYSTTGKRMPTCDYYTNDKVDAQRTARLMTTHSGEIAKLLASQSNRTPNKPCNCDACQYGSGH